MGRLKPGANYIYEKADGVTYAREFGKDPSTRFPVGWDYNNDANIFNAKFWGDILKESETNPTLQKALDRAIMIYKLSKDKLK